MVSSKLSSSSRSIVVVDRTNISVEQRSHWYRIAAEYGKSVDVFMFRRTPEDCARRCDVRLEDGWEGHPTLFKLGSGKR